MPCLRSFDILSPYHKPTIIPGERGCRGRSEGWHIGAPHSTVYFNISQLFLSKTIRNAKTHSSPLSRSDIFFPLFLWGFPGGSDGKRICLKCRRPRFSPWVRKLPCRRGWPPAPVFLPGEFPWRLQSMGLQRVVALQNHRKCSHTPQPSYTMWHFLSTFFFGFSVEVFGSIISKYWTRKPHQILLLCGWVMKVLFVFFKKNWGTSAMVQWFVLCLPVQTVWVQSPAGQLKFYMPLGQKTNIKRKNNIVTNSVKTLKWSTSKKKKNLTVRQIIQLKVKMCGLI